MNENLDILFESKENDKVDCKDNSQHTEETKRLVKGILVVYLECVEHIDQEEIKKLSICYDLSLIKKKYRIEVENRHDLLLEELIREDEDGM